VALDLPVYLRLYILEEPSFPADRITDPSFVVRSVDDLRRVADESFFESSTMRTRVIVTEMLEAAATPGRLGPVIRGFHYADTQRVPPARLLPPRHDALVPLGARRSLPLVQADLGPQVRRAVLARLRALLDLPQHRQPAGRRAAAAVREDQRRRVVPLLPAAHVAVAPRHARRLLVPGARVQYAAWKFAFHFLSRYGNEYAELMREIDRAGGAETAAKVMASLGKLKIKLDKDSFQESRLRDALLAHTDIVRLCYKDFELYHASGAQQGARAEARGRKQDGNYFDTPGRKALLALIAKTVSNDLEEAFFRMFITFNHFVLRTNFYHRDKVALCFRLAPGFLNENEYPNKPHAVFFVLGSEFRGFHVRFHDVARGGVRVIRSRSDVEYQRNLPTSFDEAYGLASTQQRKNKDIPEGGSKGVILLASDHQDKAESAFQKFVDALLDLLLPPKVVVDYLNHQEILFLGPDEGTADYMNWASAHARSRGATFWKAFTTGKSPSRGGIPHDTYGMTTRSIHAYVLGSLAKLGLTSRR
jgi:hypothetical protein